MRLIDRAKSWLRKLGPSDEAAGAPVPSSVCQGSTGQDVGASSPEGSGLLRSLPQPPPADVPERAQPAPPEPPPAPTPPKEQPAPAVPQPQPQRASQQQAPANGNGTKAMLDTRDFFAEAVHAEANRYTIKEVIGKGSYGVVCSAIDNFTGEKVAIKKITNVFEHVSDATRIVREIKLLRLLKHPDIVDIKHIMLPPSPKDFKDIYVVFELLETDLHQVIKANDDLTPEHHQFFLYQMLRGLKYIHSAKVFHRDLKPKNILANSDCKLKICDFGLARPAFNDMPTTVFWTDYVATRWYRAPELCGSFFAKYSPAIDIWSVGCIFAEVLLGKPLFPGRNVVHQLELITDLLGTPSPEVIAKVRNEKARRFLLNMRPKPGVPFEQHFPRADRAALKLLRRLLAFDPADRPTAEEALADPYFTGLHSVAREPVAQPLSKLAFEFDRRKLTLEDVRDLIYREILEYHPQMLKDYLAGSGRPNFHYPSALESFKRQFAHLEAGGAPLVRGQQGPRIFPSSSLPKEWVAEFQAEAAKYVNPAASSASQGGAVGGGGLAAGSHGGGAVEVPSAVAPPLVGAAAAAMPAPPARPPGGGAAASGGGLMGPDGIPGAAYPYAYGTGGSGVAIADGGAEMDGVYDMVSSPDADDGAQQRRQPLPPAAQNLQRSNQQLLQQQQLLPQAAGNCVVGIGGGAGSSLLNGHVSAPLLAPAGVAAAAMQPQQQHLHQHPRVASAGQQYPSAAGPGMLPQAVPLPPPAAQPQPQRCGGTAAAASVAAMHHRAPAGPAGQGTTMGMRSESVGLGS